MLSSNLNNKPRSRPRVPGAKTMPNLSLNIHIMPQTVSSHFRKWLFLGLLIFGLMVLIAVSIFWR